jgi:hypothetical protein
MNCDICGQELISGQRIYRPEPEDTGGGQMVCCSVVCALRVLGIPESTIRKMDPNLCYECGMPFPTLNDCREIDGYRYCQDCADLLITFDGCSPFAIRSSCSSDS